MKRRRSGEVGVIYLLCIRPPYHHAMHYLGFAKGTDPAARVAEHMRGQGSPLIKAAVSAKCAVTLILQKPGTRDDERAMKNRGNLRWFCPRCGPRFRDEKRARDAAYRVRVKESSDGSGNTRAQEHPATVGGDLHDSDAGHPPDSDPRP